MACDETGGERLGRLVLVLNISLHLYDTLDTRLVSEKKKRRNFSTRRYSFTSCLLGMYKKTRRRKRKERKGFQTGLGEGKENSSVDMKRYKEEEKKRKGYPARVEGEEKERLENICFWRDSTSMEKKKKKRERGLNQWIERKKNSGYVWMY